jgi:zona occludens toxin
MTLNQIDGEHFSAIAASSNGDIEEDELQHIPPNSLVVLDEAWECWPAAGVANPHESISHLAKHGHYGVDFLIITQKPHLLHTAVLAQVSVHKHILKKWSGAKMLEWPEYVQNPSVKSNRDQAVTVPFKVRTEAFELYHSGQHHTKLKQRKPYQLYLSGLLFLILPFLIYYSYASVTRSSASLDTLPISDTEQLKDEKTLFTSLFDSDLEKKQVSVNENVSKPAFLNPPQTTLQNSENLQTVKRFESLVSSDYDWTKVTACLASSRFGCVCYGLSGERLSVPALVCESAITYGWPKRT